MLKKRLKYHIYWKIQVDQLFFLKFRMNSRLKTGTKKKGSEEMKMFLTDSNVKYGLIQLL